jgi:hypothetical protein
MTPSRAARICVLLFVLMIICRTPYAGANRIRFNGTLSAGDGRVAGTPVMTGS